MHIHVSLGPVPVLAEPPADSSPAHDFLSLLLNGKQETSLSLSSYHTELAVLQPAQSSSPIKGTITTMGVSHGAMPCTGTVSVNPSQTLELSQL